MLEPIASCSSRWRCSPSCSAATSCSIRTSGGISGPDRWILEHRRVPRLDPFTFSSADRPWIDLHWGFQVALATADALGGVPGMILLASLASAAAFAIAMTARRSDWPAWVVALCWLPALALMATRFDPRPEVFSLVFLACFLAVLLRVERRPALAWVLPPIQVSWVNTHGLFILGPIVLGCYWLDRVRWTWVESRRGTHRPEQGRRPALAASGARLGRGHLLGALLNPYGIRGAMLPLELLPKIADPNNPYKSYIDEFASLRSAVLDRMVATPGIHFHLRVQVFLLLLMPGASCRQAIWRSRRESLGSPAGLIVCSVGLALVAGAGTSLARDAGLALEDRRAVPAVLSIAGARRRRLAGLPVAARRPRRWPSERPPPRPGPSGCGRILFDDGLTSLRRPGRRDALRRGGIGVLAAVAIVRAGAASSGCCWPRPSPTCRSRRSATSVSSRWSAGRSWPGIWANASRRSPRHGRIASRRGYPARWSSRWSRRGLLGVVTNRYYHRRWRRHPLRPARAVVDVRARRRPVRRPPGSSGPRAGLPPRPGRRLCLPQRPRSQGLHRRPAGSSPLVHIPELRPDPGSAQPERFADGTSP